METILSALITGLLSVIAVIITTSNANKKIEQALLVSQAVTDTKIEGLTTQMDTLTDEVKKHNNFGLKIASIETKMQTLESRLEKVEAKV